MARSSSLPRSPVASIGALLLAAVTTLSSWTVPHVARADAGSVQLRSGAIITGNVVAVLPRDRVMIQAAGAQPITFRWDDVALVIDGPRVYDANGTLVSQPAPVSPTSAPSPVYSGYRPGPVAADTMAAGPTVPGRGGTVTMYVFGSLMIVGGALWVAAAASVECSYGCPGRGAAFALGGSALVGGALLTGFAIRRSKRRHALLGPNAELLVPTPRTARIAFDLDVGRNRFVPSLAFRF